MDKFAICKCGKRFKIIKDRRTKYCSRSCYLKYHAEDSYNPETHESLICKHCGKEFSNWKCLNRKFCSPECYFEYKHKKRTGTIIQCDWCHKDFYEVPRNLERSNNHFCSKQCYSFYQETCKGSDTNHWKERIEIICETCGKRFLVRPSDYKRRFCSKKCFVNAKVVTHHLRYKKSLFRSSWEANFAKWLDGSGIKWEYESKTFSVRIKGKNTWYLPDFYLPEFDAWIEIKGWWQGHAKEKVEQCQQKYPNINLIVLRRPELTMLGVI